MRIRELGMRFSKVFYQVRDRWRPPRFETFGNATPAPDSFPQLPSPSDAPASLLSALRSEVEDIKTGKWKAFGRLDIQVADPPLWQKDHLADIDLFSQSSAFNLNYRHLPRGADIMPIWDLSRWRQLVRLAQANWLLSDQRAGQICQQWLSDWTVNNIPYRGWNWTSALESGMRLIQYAWIDALLTAANGENQLQELRLKILPAHIWYTWRYRSVGSSANNHLLGELAGLIISLTRWPDWARWAKPIEKLHALWEQEVLRQFAVDGGNKEQALNYQLFAWELCWQTRMALVSVGRTVQAEVDDRLLKAAHYYASVQSPANHWDYGDSDNAFVTPFFTNADQAAREWWLWFKDGRNSQSIHYWLGSEERKTAGAQSEFDAVAGESPVAGVHLKTRSSAKKAGWGWQVYSESGIAVNRSKFWFLRWDLSALGYLATAAHGHLDALHLSIWRQGEAVVIDPGTGAYHFDPKLRKRLTSWSAHNGPHIAGYDFPKRVGPFLWGNHHSRPTWRSEPNLGVIGELSLPIGRLSRAVTFGEDQNTWRVNDKFQPTDPDDSHTLAVTWQFAPQSQIEQLSDYAYRLKLDQSTVDIELSETWAELELQKPSEESYQEDRLIGICAPSFRNTSYGPVLRLTGNAHMSCLFSTTFIASDLA
jgi:hypothetical protein